MNQTKAVQKLQRLEELKGEVLDAFHGEWLVVDFLQEIIEGQTKALKHHAVVTFPIKGLVQHDAVRFPPTALPVQVFHNICFNHGRIAVSLDIANNLNGNNVLVVDSTATTTVIIISTVMTLSVLLLLLSASILLLQIEAFHDPSKGSESDLFQDSVLSRNYSAESTAKMTNRIIVMTARPSCTLFGRRRQRIIPFLLLFGQSTTATAGGENSLVCVRNRRSILLTAALNIISSSSSSTFPLEQ